MDKLCCFRTLVKLVCLVDGLNANKNYDTDGSLKVENLSGINDIILL